MWLKEFAASTGRAFGQAITYELRPTVNPLVYNIKLKWRDPINGKLKSNIWNLFEIWAYKNDSVPQGRAEMNDCEVRFSIAIKQRFGVDKDILP